MGLLGKGDCAESAQAARAQAHAPRVEGDLVAGLDTVEELRFDLGKGQRDHAPPTSA